MSTVQADTATTTTADSFKEFRAAKSAGTLESGPSGAAPAREAPAAKVAPSPEADESQEPLTEKDLEGEKARVRSKMAKLLSQRANAQEETKAQIAKREALEAELAELKSAKPQWTGKDAPTLKAYLDSGKFKSWEEAHDAFLEARDDWKAAKSQAAEQQKTHETVVETTRTAYQESVAELEAAYPNANHSEDLKIVAGTIEDMVVQDAMSRSKNPAFIVHYLAQNEDVLEELAGASTKDALMLLGEIRSRVSKSETKETPTKKQPDLPRAPRNLTARGDAPNSLQAMRIAGDAEDMRAFKAAKRANQGT